MNYDFLCLSLNASKVTFLSLCAISGRVLLSYRSPCFSAWLSKATTSNSHRVPLAFSTTAAPCSHVSRWGLCHSLFSRTYILPRRSLSVICP
nr:MAG TPA: hypothetical protein [Caudoviricetes sp.]